MTSHSIENSEIENRFQILRIDLKGKKLNLNISSEVSLILKQNIYLPWSCTEKNSWGLIDAGVAEEWKFSEAEFLVSER